MDRTGVDRQGASSPAAAGGAVATARAIVARSRGIAWWGLAILLLAVKGGDAIDCVSIPRDLADFCARDLSQDWIAARAVLNGRPPYAPLRSLVVDEFGPDALPLDAAILPYDAHPPGTVLLTLPLGLLNYKAAWIVWTVLSVLALLASLALILRKLTGRIASVGLFPLLIVLATSHPFQETIYHGQLNCLLLLLVTAAWVALEKWPRAAGAMIGLAAVVKLFPGLLLVPLTGRRRWTAIAAAIACVATLTIAAVAAVGLGNGRAYVLDVVPSIGPDHAAAWGNQSLVGLYHKLFGDARGRFRPLYRSAALERAATLATVAAVCGFAIAAAARERRANRGPDDRSYLLTTVGFVLVSPVAWNHYFILLILPMAWLLATARRPSLRIALYALAAILWTPRWTIWKWAAPGSVHDGRFDVVGPLATATGLATQTYALLLICIIMLCMIFDKGAAPFLGRRRGAGADQDRQAAVE